MTMPSEERHASRQKRRFQTELDRLAEVPTDFFSMETKQANPYAWVGTVKGPSHSPYAHGKYKTRIEFPQEYPRLPPKIKFETKIYHPCVDEEGSIALRALLLHEWSPVMTIGKLLLDVEVVLNDPETDNAVVERKKGYCCGAADGPGRV
ncbi:ubiquitin-conjugating enzyme [Pseudovirgaria hyperparasitica]|uniref:Ubiquitin-conjugating enzyme n=1 Tax=Pseudovirgaria hyperparasitica TaxID=470096 RepID=A0A6A6WMQ8_9PEZI|nr:ubiquitin-conjugating enzyme [Pseudovirgaria hyperparasitica]KAF2763495.1 ubiquitin-conjugating enzyme [Pseudovirgaria hyperparasitica]